MPIVYSSVACSEVHGSRKENWSIRDGVKCSVDLHVTYANRYNLILDLLTSPGFWPYTPTGIMPPAVVSANEAIIPGDYVEDGQGTYYDMATISVNYEQTFEDPEDPEPPENRQLYTERIRTTPEYLMARGETLYFELDPAQRPLSGVEVPAVIRMNYVLERTIFGMTTIPADMLDLQNKVNSTAYTSKTLGLTFPAETLLFAPQDMNRSVSFPSGTQGWTTTVAFMFKKGGWNKFIDIKDAQFREQGLKLKRDHSDFKPFASADFSNWLF